MKRVLLIILDGVGVGWSPDAGLYGDEGSNTLAHVAAYVDGLNLPNLEAFGLRNVLSLPGMDSAATLLRFSHPYPRVFAPSPKVWANGRLRKHSPGKDSMTGHWELAGLVVDFEFKTFPEGFPNEVIEEFEKRTGRKALGNVPASGTEIIERLGRRHLETGYPIVYTSQDSVFQIAAHKDIIGVDELYRLCEVAREILAGPYLVGRVIARPFTGSPGSFVRTAERRDFSVKPPEETVLDRLKKEGYEVWGIGKIEDLFSGCGLTRSFHTKSNSEGIKRCKYFLEECPSGLGVCNLVDFDTLYGHRNNARGFYDALVEFDQALPGIVNAMDAQDLLLITADHGCDPLFPGTDHTREDVPLFVYGYPDPKKGSLKAPVYLGVGAMADVGASIADFFDVSFETSGKSFLKSTITPHPSLETK